MALAVPAPEQLERLMTTAGSYQPALEHTVRGPWLGSTFRGSQVHRLPGGPQSRSRTDSIRLCRFSRRRYTWVVSPRAWPIRSCSMSVSPRPGLEVLDGERGPERVDVAVDAGAGRGLPDEPPDDAGVAFAVRRCGVARDQVVVGGLVDAGCVAASSRSASLSGTGFRIVCRPSPQARGCGRSRRSRGAGPWRSRRGGSRCRRRR